MLSQQDTPRYFFKTVLVSKTSKLCRYNVDADYGDKFCDASFRFEASLFK